MRAVGIILAGIGLGLVFFLGIEYESIFGLLETHRGPPPAELVKRGEAKSARKFQERLESMEDLVRNTQTENRRLTKLLRQSRIKLEAVQAKVVKGKASTGLQSTESPAVISTESPAAMHWPGAPESEPSQAEAVDLQAPQGASDPEASQAVEPAEGGEPQDPASRLQQAIATFEKCNIIFAMFSVIPGGRKVLPHQLYTPESVQMMHPGCPIVLLTDATSDTSSWTDLGEEVTVRRLDPFRSQQMHNTSELMLFRHLMELELLNELAANLTAAQKAQA
eukprot:CAMPEP_0118929522 /NCGR_PEP_ID=MMETSP1169-20130426/6501_1 /TAXON_ID=36882 /ORGANISM="Pyramimonas obovata, Strain CCMP722" /LENGTH=278 /DNA_ID=CAMNT_0006871729 /DNA_START=184 /DNA_END=1016 /DNA_ORIENTATION=+